MGRSAKMPVTGLDQRPGAVALPSMDDLQDMILALHQSRKQLAWMESAAEKCIQQASEAFGKDTFLLQQKQWSSHKAMLKDWDDEFAADLKKLHSNKFPVIVSETADTPDSKLKDADEGRTSKVLINPTLQDRSNTSIVTSWAARFKAALSPDQLGGASKSMPKQPGGASKSFPNQFGASKSVSGTISKLMRSSGYGFFAQTGGGGNIFFHAKSCNVDFDALREGQKARFQVNTDSSGRRVATDVQFPEPPTSVPAKKVTQTPMPAKKVTQTPMPAKKVTPSPMSATKVMATPLLDANPFAALAKSKSVKPTSVPAKKVTQTPMPAKKVTQTPMPAKKVTQTPMPAKKVTQTPMPAKKMVATPLLATPVPATKEQRDAQKLALQSMPSLREGEVELLVDDPLTWQPVSTTRSQSLKVKNFRFNILAFPNGTKSHAGRCLGAFVEAVPGDVEPDSIFEDVRYEITIVNWIDFAKSLTRTDTFVFKASGRDIDRGWHDFLSKDKMQAGSSWVGPAGSVCIRARCTVAKTANWK